MGPARKVARIKTKLVSGPQGEYVAAVLVVVEVLVVRVDGIPCAATGWLRTPYGAAP